MLFSALQSKTLQNNTELLKWHKLKCSGRSFSDAFPETSASNHIDRCGSRFAETLGDWPSQKLLGTQTTPGGASPLWRSDYFSTWDLSCQWEEKLFPSGELSGTQNIPCQLLVLPAGPGQRIRKALNWSEVLLCPSIEPGLMLLQLPTFPERVEDLAGRVWRLWRRSSFILGLGGGTQAPVWCPGTPGSSWELQYAAIHIPN